MQCSMDGGDDLELFDVRLIQKFTLMYRYQNSEYCVETY